ncbi:MAG TPA: hypothetical protein VHB45_06230 [Alloacidobacterium sp.]|nr:hypothetical protein [Alloacidobacterium sp.]
MKPNHKRLSSARVFAVSASMMLCCLCATYAQAQPAPANESYQTFYLTALTQQREANDIVTDLRNMLPKAKIYYVGTQNAVSVRGSADDIQLVQKILSDLNHPKKLYRLTYTIAESDGSKPQRYSLVVAAGQKSIFKLGNRVPVVTGMTGENAGPPNSQVQYLDVGINLEASLASYPDGLKLETKIEQSHVVDEKSNVGTQDPMIHQTMLETTASLPVGKPLVVGSLDIPDSTQRKEVTVLAELIP